MDDALAALRDAANNPTDLERAMDMIVAARAPVILLRESQWKQELEREKARSGGDLRREKGEARLHQELVNREREMSKVKAENARLRTDLDLSKQKEQEYLARYDQLVPELENTRLHAAEGQASVERLAKAETEKENVTTDYRSLLLDFEVLQSKFTTAEDGVKMLRDQVAVLEDQLTAMTAAKKALKDNNLDLASRIDKHEVHGRAKTEMIEKGKTLLRIQSQKYQAEMMALEKQFENVRCINRGLCNWLVETRGRASSPAGQSTDMN